MMRVIRLWKKRSRKLRYWLGPIRWPVLIAWGVLELVRKSALTLMKRAGEPQSTPKKRKNPPGWAKKRMKAFAANRSRNHGLLRCEQCGYIEKTGDRSFHWHHVKSWKWWPEARDYVENMAVWCSVCNLGASDNFHTRDLQPCPRKKAA